MTHRNPVSLRARLTAAMATLVRHYLIRFPDGPGRYRLLHRLRPALQKYIRSPWPVTLTTRHGYRMEVDLADWLGRYVALTGEYEPPTTRVVSRLLRPGDRFVDVGANVGYFTLLARKIVGAEGEVIAFEPNPAVRVRLEENLRRNDFEDVVVHASALSDTTRTVRFSVAPVTHTGRSAIRSLADAEQVIDVETRRLDDELAGVSSLRLIKVDVEGAETRVLRGAIETLERLRPHVILEMTPTYLEETGSSKEELMEVFASLDYGQMMIAEGVCPLRPLEEPPDQYNALFYPRERLDELAPLCEQRA